MAVVLSLFFVLSASMVGTLGNNGSTDNYPVGDPRRCMLAGDPKYRFEVLPGGGWDNLRNKEMGMVVSFNYSMCRTTEDGRYLLPDGVYTIPLKSSKVETYAELITHWSNYTRLVILGIQVHSFETSSVLFVSLCLYVCVVACVGGF